MKASDGIVYGGGWNKLSERPIKCKAICCLALIAPAVAASVRLPRIFEAWGFVAAFGLFVLSIFLFRFERPQVWYWPPARWPDSAKYSREPKVPKHDLRNLIETNIDNYRRHVR